MTYRFAGGYLGAVVGRVANRLARGRFTVDGATDQVATNERAHTLHGGFEGFDRMPWTVEEADTTHARLTLTSPDGDGGFPGRVDVTVTYSVSPGEVRIEYSATSDRPTPFNVTNHAYLNLDGEGSGPVDDHVLEVPASAFTPTDAELIPTGEVRAVDGTPFDLRRAPPARRRPRRRRRAAAARPGPGPQPRPRRHGAAPRGAVRGAGGRVLEVLTDQPGVQVYTGAHFDDSVVGPSGRTYGPRAGIALETQGFPDAPNHRGVPRHHAAARCAVPLDDDLAADLTSGARPPEVAGCRRGLLRSP